MNENQQHAGALAPPEPFFAELFDELTTRLQAGESMDVEAYLRDHPEHASELQRFLPAIEVLVELGHSAARGRPLESAALPEHSSRSGVLGDFRILRELGRGGMGLVYEAEQLSLGRRVALKVLPFAATMDHRQLQRFKNEAHAVAQLHHTNIVPVYSVGCERGVHFYAMQFIEGQSLAAVIADLRLQNADVKQAPTMPSTARGFEPEGFQPTGPYPPGPRHDPQSEICDVRWLPPAPAPGGCAEGTVAKAGLSTEKSIRRAAYFRTVAHLGIQAAEALDHAHQMGVIHRDIKPANLLVQYGTGGSPATRLWVTDFGLAQVQGDARLSMTGDLVGTLRYMSPEQALAKRVVVDHRTDIYSLGVTLYELLTLEHAFDGADREELLRQIAFEEPKPPRRINRAIPLELDVIVLKAMEKNPAERFTTAQELADDLRRFLEDKPILARRPTLVRRARKWTRRHPPVVWSALIVLMLAVMMLVGSGIWFERQRATRLAETERGVTAALAKAMIYLDEGDDQIDEPERWHATVRLAESAVEAADELMATGETTPELRDRVEEVRARLEQAATDSSLRAELDQIRLEVSLMKGVDREGFYDQQGTLAPRYAALLRSYGIDPAEPEETAARVRGSRLRDALLAALQDWYWIAREPSVRQRLEQVLDRAEPTANGWPAKWRQAWRKHDAAALKRLAEEAVNQPLPATASYGLATDVAILCQEFRLAERVARAGLERNPRDFWLIFRLGTSLAMQVAPPAGQAGLGRVQFAVDNHGLPSRKARAEEACRYLQVAAALRPDPLVYSNLGAALLFAGDLDGAIRELKHAIELRPNYAMAHINLGTALYHKRDLDGAINAWQTAIQLDPNSSGAHNNLGNALQDKGNLEEAIREFRTAIELDPHLAPAHDGLGTALHGRNQLDAAIIEHQVAIQLDPDVALFHNRFGIALETKGDRDGAIREFRAAVHLQPNAALFHMNLGRLLHDKQDFAEAIHELQSAVRMDTKLEPARRYLGTAHINFGHALVRKRDWDRAIAEFEAGLKIYPADAGAHNNLGNALSEKGNHDGAILAYQAAIKNGYPQAHNNLGLALARKGDMLGAIREYKNAIKVFPAEPNAHFNLGLVYLHQGRFIDAVDSFKKAHGLAKDRNDWAEFLHGAERLASLDAKLPMVLSGETKPEDAAEAIDLAQFCQEHEKRNAAAARLYSTAFNLNPQLMDDQDATHRYNAACAAALAGCGQGQDVAKLDDKERARLRRQALDWLGRDLPFYSKLAAGGPAEVRAFVQKRMQHWLSDPDLAGVRGDALAKLPEAERKSWQQLWAAVEQTLKKTNHKGMNDNDK
jgi:serine/threonine protein kinase/tetratricopeptide (TPR) repeat protein